jgi:Gpi18-like mannosyltransferase
MTIHSSRRGTAFLPPQSSTKPTTSPSTESTTLTQRDYVWIFGTWLLSRGLIIFVLQWVAPGKHWMNDGYWDPIVGWIDNFIPTAGWDLFTHWDGAWYRKIAELGYDYEHGVDRRATVVFFPAFPLLCWGLMKLGLPYAIAGTIISNLACLGAMYILYRWVKNSHGEKVARWSLIALGFMPCAVFSVVAYTESLFLLATLGALYYFHRQRYGWATFWGIVMTATRPPGLLIVPTLLWISWRQKRSPRAYVSAIAMAIGCVLFSLYCGWKFGYPMAWISSHGSWADGVVSWRLLVERMFYPQSGAWLRMGIILTSLGFLWHYRRELMPEMQVHTGITIAMLLASNSTEGLSRYLYVLPGLSIAFGIFLARHRMLRFLSLVVSMLLLILWTMHFAWYHFVS